MIIKTRNQKPSKKHSNEKIVKWLMELNDEMKKGISRVEELKFKEILLVKGFTEVEEIQYNEIFYPVINIVMKGYL